MTDPLLDMSLAAMTATPEPRSGGGRPKAGAYLLDGRKVPSVSTILGRFKDSGGLIQWAYKQGKEGRELYEARDKAADIGSAVHDAIEAFVCRREAAPTFSTLDADGAAAASLSFNAFGRWWRGNDVKVTDTEVPLVSRFHRFGGTIDAVGTVAGQPAIVDWKTGKGTIYPEHIAQVCAYAHLWHETRGELPAELHVLRPSKHTGGFNHFSIPTAAAEPAWRFFLALREAYELDAVVKGLTG